MTQKQTQLPDSLLGVAIAGRAPDGCEPGVTGGQITKDLPYSMSLQLITPIHSGKPHATINNAKQLFLNPSHGQPCYRITPSISTYHDFKPMFIC